MNVMADKYSRRVKHFLVSGCLFIGFEHFLVMFPSAMLIAKIANTQYGPVIELPSILLACGIGTLLFGLLTRWRVPFFLGPSFAYIGFVSLQVAYVSKYDDLDAVRSTVFYGYFIAGFFLIVLCLLYRFKSTKSLINTVFPSTVMGPAISLIGLELANMAAGDSGFNGNDGDVKFLSIITLFSIIVFSLLRHHFLQNASILIGVIIGCIAATFIGLASWPAITKLTVTLPKFNISSIKGPPNNLITLALSVFPCSMIAFIESLGRITVFNGMLKRDDKYTDESLSNHGILMHSITNTITALLFMMPSAIYAENLAIMNLHSAESSTNYIREKDDDIFINNCYSAYSYYPYFVASALSIFVASINGLQEIFTSIPLAVLGGMELFVFGLIAAPGIQLLVEQQINYKKISNQIITASVLLAGISNISITYKSLSLHGMSLGLTTGVIVNIIVLILGRFGYLNERFSLVEVIDACSNFFEKKVVLYAYDKDQVLLDKELEASEIKEFIRKNEIGKILNKSSKIIIEQEIRKKRISIKQDSGGMKLEIKLSVKNSKRLLNDYPRITVLDEGNRIKTVVLDEFVSRWLLGEILRMAE